MADSENTTTPGRAPAFQFYPKDFLTDENVCVMSLQERGAYITLLCICWSEGSLPADVPRLARLCGAPLTAFRKLWPALEPCFRVGETGRLVHPRLERERQNQAEYRRRQSDASRARWDKAKASHGIPAAFPRDSHGNTRPASVRESSTSASASSPASADSSQKTADARSKRPIFRGQRLTVFEWMLNDLTRMLGSHSDAFDLHAWFYELDARAEAGGEVIPQRDGGAWLHEQTLAEAIRRGLPLARVAASTGKTSGNLVAAARFVARGAK